MIGWIRKNKEWLFQGAGLVILLGIYTLLKPHMQRLSTYLEEYPSLLLAGLVGSTLTLAVILLAFRLKARWKADPSSERLPDGEANLACDIIPKGLPFFQEQLGRVAKSGGSIFTTAIFENYAHGDKVSEYIVHELRAKGNDSSELSFTRFLLLDDPSSEYRWMRKFLELRALVTPKTHGFSLRPVILHVRNRNRPLVRYLANSLPRVSITLVKSEGSRDKPSDYLVYFGFVSGISNPDFGLAFRSPRIYEKTLEFLSPTIQRADRYDDPNQVPNSPAKELVLNRRLADCMLEFAELRNEILHIALFGSSGLVANDKLGISQTTDLEADFDLLIVLAHDADLNDCLKQEIEQEIRKEQLDPTAPMEIEWSNLEGKYYEERRGIHVDIQVHKRGDEYYSREALLLGYSVFGEGYKPIYSSTSEVVQSYLVLPTRLMDRSERISLVLDSKQFGLLDAIQKISDDTAYPRTDPKRVLWIQLANAVWALTGRRPYSRTVALEFIGRTYFNRRESTNIVKRLSSVLNHKEPHPSRSKPLRDECGQLLDVLRVVLEKGTK